MAVFFNVPFVGELSGTKIAGLLPQLLGERQCIVNVEIARQRDLSAMGLLYRDAR